MHETHFQAAALRCCSDINALARSDLPDDSWRACMLHVLPQPLTALNPLHVLPLPAALAQDDTPVQEADDYNDNYIGGNATVAELSVFPYCRSVGAMRGAVPKPCHCQSVALHHRHRQDGATCLCPLPHTLQTPFTHTHTPFRCADYRCGSSPWRLLPQPLKPSTSPSVKIMCFKFLSVGCAWDTTCCNLLKKDLFKVEFAVGG